MVFILFKGLRGVLGNSVMCLFNLKNILSFMRKNTHDRILRDEPKEQYLNTILNFQIFQL